jgi:hypothetical protein
MILSAASFLSLAVSMGFSFIVLRKMSGTGNVHVPLRIASRRKRRS